MKKKKKNPHCPVPGCRTKQPHLASLTTQGLHQTFSNPTKLAQWVKMCIVELIQSTIDDVNNHRFFGYLTRWRQPEELYYRALHMLFVADEASIPHRVSGELPNSFSTLWTEVNRVVFDGRGSLDKPQLGLNGEEFTAMDTLNSSAHASFATIATCIGVVRNPSTTTMVRQHVDYWKTLCNHLDYIEHMFKDGKTKAEVLAGFKELQKNPAAWQTKKPDAPPDCPTG